MANEIIDSFISYIRYLDIFLRFIEILLTPLLKAEITNIPNLTLVNLKQNLYVTFKNENSLQEQLHVFCFVFFLTTADFGLDVIS